MSYSVIRTRALPVAFACVLAACASQEEAAPPAPTPASLSVSMSTELDAAASDVWELVGDFGGIDGYVDIVESVDLEGEGVGAVRTLHLADGAKVVETLTANDPAAMRYSYSLSESPLPVEGYEATMAVTELEGGRSRVDWQSTFQAAGVSDEEARTSVAGVYEMGFAGMKTRFPDERGDEGEVADE